MSIYGQHNFHGQIKSKVGKAIIIVKVFILVTGLFLVSPSFGQQPNKIQNAINSTKDTYSDENNDYVTDGQRTVWVKSYKKWTPEDITVVLKKESPSTLRFLGMAAQSARYDVLEQLLPDYYKTHGGVKGFAADIMRVQPATQTNEAPKTRQPVPNSH